MSVQAWRPTGQARSDRRRAEVYGVGHWAQATLSISTGGVSNAQQHPENHELVVAADASTSSDPTGHARRRPLVSTSVFVALRYDF